MKKLLSILLATMPLWGLAQHEKTAAYQLLSENAGRYLREKIFKGQDYEPGAFTDLSPVKDNKSAAAWSVRHACQSHYTFTEYGKSTKQLRQYHFTLLLNKKMEVLNATASYKVAGIEN